jgi:hypothetical protein
LRRIAMPRPLKPLPMIAMSVFIVGRSIPISYGYVT